VVNALAHLTPHLSRVTVFKSEDLVRVLLRCVLFTCCVCFLVSGEVVAAEPVPFHSALSLEGFTGVLNTPNAFVTEEGWLYALYSNQRESKWRNKVPFEDNYTFSIGFFNFVELGGRFFEAPHAGRDLSGNVKVTSAALTRNYPLLPVLGIGVQDLGGGDTHLRTSYVVVSEDFWRLRLSAGYGHGPDRMKGAFAGGEFKAHDWVYLLGDYDTKETNLGVRVILPQFWKVPVRFTASAKTSLNYKPGNFDVAVGFTLPLDFRVRNAPPKSPAPDAATPPPLSPAPQSVPVAGAPSGAAAHTVAATKAGSADLAGLRDSLVAQGFLNVRVGALDRTLVVEYENTVFNHNELDALGVVSGLACRAAGDSFDNVRVVIKKRDIRLATVSAPLGDLRAFLEHPEAEATLREHLSFDFDSREPAGTVFLSPPENSSFLNTSLVLSPGLTTFLGTEVGVFDYLLSLKPELTTTLWDGAALHARWDLPIAWSANLDDGRTYRSNRHPAQMERLMLFQALKPLPTVMVQLGAGMIVHDRYGMLNEALWSPGDGQHRFRVVQGFDSDSSTKKNSNLMLGTYRYFYGPLDLSLEVAAGKFWAEDKGGSLELKRFWQDTAVSLYYKNTKGPDDKKWQAVGLQFSFPLTPRRDMRPLAKLQVRGSEEWSYAQETTLKNNNYNNPRGSLNYLAPYPLALNPQPATALARTFYNRDRLSAAYLRQHLSRLREAWLKYGTPEAPGEVASGAPGEVDRVGEGAAP